jgi:hypothetical protein
MMIKCCQCKGSHEAWHYKYPIRATKRENLREVRHQLPLKFIVSNRTPQEPETEEEEKEEEEEQNEEKQEKEPSSNGSDINSPFSNTFSSRPFFGFPSFNCTMQEAESSVSSNSVSIFDTFPTKNPLINKETFGKH